MGEAMALVTLLNRKMIIGFKVFLTSFLFHNPWFEDDIVILDLDLKDDEKKELKKWYPKIIFKGIQEKNYKDVDMRKTADKLKPTYYKLDVFDIEGYSRLVFIDVDVVILDNISELFSAELEGIAAIKGYSEKTDNLRDDINSGVLVITEYYLNKETYNGVVEAAKPGHSMPDQKVINQYFKGKMQYFNKSFNVEKRMEHTANFSHVLAKKKIVHFVAGKPWEKNDDEKGKYPAMEAIWNEWYEKTMERENELKKKKDPKGEKTDGKKSKRKNLNKESKNSRTRTKGAGEVDKNEQPEADK